MISEPDAEARCSSTSKGPTGALPKTTSPVSVDGSVGGSWPATGGAREQAEARTTQIDRDVPRPIMKVLRGIGRAVPTSQESKERASDGPMVWQFPGRPRRARIQVSNNALMAPGESAWIA
jgi:hypothetical protein